MFITWVSKSKQWNTKEINTTMVKLPGVFGMGTSITCSTFISIDLLTLALKLTNSILKIDAYYNDR